MAQHLQGKRVAEEVGSALVRVHFDCRSFLPSLPFALVALILYGTPGKNRVVESIGGHEVINAP